MEYRELREQRMRENKRRLEELGLNQLSQELMSSASPRKRAKEQSTTIKIKMKVEVAPTRRSSRVAAIEKIDYRETRADIGRLIRKSSIATVKLCNDGPRMATFEAAQAAEKRLDSGCPSFVKSMLKSHVSRGFWLGLPAAFCSSYMPKKDQYLTLEDEKDKEWETLYLAHKNGLSGGWRGFAMDHELEDGDALVFELVEKLRFKVYIVRAANYETSAAASPEDGSSGDKKVAFKLTPKTKVIDIEDDKESEERPKISGKNARLKDNGKSNNKAARNMSAKENLPPVRRSSRLTGK